MAQFSKYSIIPISFCVTLFFASNVMAQTCLEIFSNSNQVERYESPVSAMYEAAQMTYQDILDFRVAAPSYRIIGQIAESEFGERSEQFENTGLKAVAERQSQQLVVIFNGFAHALDQYIALGPRTDISYVVPRLGNPADHPIYSYGTKLSAKNLNRSEMEFIEAVAQGNFQQNPDLNTYPLFIAGLNKQPAASPMRDGILGQLANRSDTYLQPPAQPLDLPSATSLTNVVIIGDMHEMQAELPVAAFPTPAELLARGINEIVLYMEGIDPHEPARIEKLKAQATMQFLPLNQMNNSDRRTFLAGLSRMPNGAWLKKMLADQSVIIDPVRYQLLNLMNTYQNKRIKITIKSMEEK